MIYGIKAIHTHTVGEDDRRFYEEVILCVEAADMEEAYDKAAAYMKEHFCDYTNSRGEPVKTLKVELVDCFLSLDPEGGVEEVYSAFSVNKSGLSEDEYYRMISEPCDAQALFPLRSC